MLENYEKTKEREQSDRVSELAQKLYNEDGYAGNLYKSYKDQIYEDKAMKIIEKENRNNDS
jgi:hypothetical protein